MVSRWGRSPPAAGKLQPALSLEGLRHPTSARTLVPRIRAKATPAPVRGSLQPMKAPTSTMMRRTPKNRPSLAPVQTTAAAPNAQPAAQNRTALQLIRYVCLQTTAASGIQAVMHNVATRSGNPRPSSAYHSPTAVSPLQIKIIPAPAQTAVDQLRVDDRVSSPQVESGARKRDHSPILAHLLPQPTLRPSQIRPSSIEFLQLFLACRAVAVGQTQRRRDPEARQILDRVVHSDPGVESKLPGVERRHAPPPMTNRALKNHIVRDIGTTVGLSDDRVVHRVLFGIPRQEPCQGASDEQDQTNQSQESTPIFASHPPTDTAQPSEVPRRCRRTALESALTESPSLSPLESALTKNPGQGECYVNLRPLVESKRVTAYCCGPLKAS
jgi:hypothetical protein